MENDPTSIFHPGELGIQSRLGVRDRIARVAAHIVRDHLPEQHRDFYARLPLLFVASVDETARPWASVLAGMPGFISSPDPWTLAVNAKPFSGDALRANLQIGARVGLLGIEYSSRRRNRMNGEVSFLEGDNIRVAVGQTFGNCPKYIQSRDYQFLPGMGRIGESVSTQRIAVFDQRCREIISSADNFYIATSVAALAGDIAYGSDISHRGGKPGFVQINDKRTLTFPDYVGNFLFNSLGNIMLNPRAGLLFIDFESGDLLAITCKAEIIWDSKERQVFAAAERLVRLTLDEGVLMEKALPIIWGQPSFSAELNATGSWEDVKAKLGRKESQNRYQSYTVTNIKPESDTITSFYLQPADGGAIPRHVAGQFLPIELSVPGHPTPLRRTYTISSAAGESGYRLSIKREPASSSGLASGIVSNYFHDQVKIGTGVQAMSPRGKFTIIKTRDRGVVLLSGGVGITPMISMLLQLVEEYANTSVAKQVWFIHGTRNGATHAFGREVREIAARHPWLNVHILYSRPRHNDIELKDYDSTGRIDIDLVTGLLSNGDYDYYLCGPDTFVDSLHAGLKEAGDREQRVHYEFFGARTSLASRKPAVAISYADGPEFSEPVNVYFAKSGVTAVWDRTKGSLLDLAEAHGLRPTYSCRSGVCQSCLTPVLAGNVAYLEPPMADPGTGQVLLCCA